MQVGKVSDNRSKSQNLSCNQKSEDEPKHWPSPVRPEYLQRDKAQASRPQRWQKPRLNAVALTSSSADEDQQRYYCETRERKANVQEHTAEHPSSGYCHKHDGDTRTGYITVTVESRRLHSECQS